jgi:hypothetical protein
VGELKLSPAQDAYLAFEEEWIRRNAELLHGLGSQRLLELTGLMLAQRRALGLPTRLRAIAGRRFPTEAESESSFLSPQPDGCGACMAELEE